jgi:hypothetical protein
VRLGKPIPQFPVPRLRLGGSDVIHDDHIVVSFRCSLPGALTVLHHALPPPNPGAKTPRLCGQR